jgi:hypothetical protein
MADPRTVVQHSLLHRWEPPPYVAPPEPAAKPAPLTYKECRARLAEVIDAFAATTDRLQKLSAAHQRARRDSTEAFMSVERCEALIEEARQDQPRSYVNRILNGADDEPEDLVAAAQKRLDEATHQRELAKQGEAIIADEIAATERRLASLRYDRTDRIKELVQASPAAAKLREQWAELLARLASTLAAFQAIEPTGRLPGWNGLIQHNGAAPILVHPGDAPEWQAALAALESDPAAKLPGE